MSKLFMCPGGRLTAVLLALALCLVGFQPAQATNDRAAGRTPVAETKAGTMTSRLVGSTADGRAVSGNFVPLGFVKRDGKLFVRGLAQGVVDERRGDDTTFATMKTARVKSINGEPTRVGSAARSEAPAGKARCNVLNLRLAPLDLDLLGLQVHLDRVVLDVVAASGSGKLLGNLLCAVAGLLDGGLGGVLGQLTRLLNRILGLLRIG